MSGHDEFEDSLQRAGRTGEFAEPNGDSGMLDRVVARVLGEAGPAQTIGRFRIERLVGRGGLGQVYAAWDPELDRRVAIKILHRGADDRDHVRRAITAEARTLARLADRHVLSVFEIGEHAGSLFLVMEFLDGGDLETWQGEPRPLREVLGKYVQAGRGLAAAHRVGLVHRDFKPSNVLLRADGDACVGDFGLARLADASWATPDADGVSQSGGGSTECSVFSNALGTPQSMAPEQIEYDTVDRASDQFSFCVALFRALCRRYPHTTEQLHAMARDPDGAASPFVAADPVPQWLVRILRRGLSARASARWPSMDELCDLLARVPEQRRRRGFAVLAVGGLAASIALARGGTRAPTCDVTAELGDAYAPERLAEALVEPELGAVRARLAQYVDEWHAGYRDVCNATWIAATRSPDDYATATACFDRAAVALRRAQDLVMDRAPAARGRALDVVAALPDIRACVDPDTGQPRDASDERAHAVADEAELLLAAGRPQDALARIDDGPVRPADRGGGAEAVTMARARALAAIARYDEAERDFLHVAAAATERGGARSSFAAWAGLLDLYGYDVPDLPRATIAEAMADAESARFAPAPAARAALLHARARVSSLRGDHLGALALLHDAIALARDDSDPVGGARHRRGQAVVLSALGRGQDARAELEALRRDVERSLGPRHAEIGLAEHALASMALDEGRYADARTHATTAIAVLEDALGADAPRLAPSLAIAAQVEFLDGQLEAAVRLATRARGLESTLPSGHPDRGPALGVLGPALATLGRCAEALPAYEDYLRERADRMSDVERQSVHQGIGWCLCQIGRCREARPHFEAITVDAVLGRSLRAAAEAGLADVELAEGFPFAAAERAARVLAELDEAGVDDAELIAELRWTEARALAATNRHEEARNSAHMALSSYRERPRRPRVDEIEAFLRGR